jgi:hypothetical protein
MMFDQPVAATLRDSQRVLLAGCGGGYDVLGAVPLASELIAAGKEVEFASFSFTRLNRVAGHKRVREVPHLYVATAAAATPAAYCPEAWLASWFGARFKSEARVWCFENVGVAPLRHAYEHLVTTLNVDAVVLIDGGIDSLLRGNETSLGTPAEDFASLAAVDSLSVPVKLLACVGFGAELRDGICHAQALERMAEITAAGGLLGVWPLITSTRAADEYRDAAEFIGRRQRKQHGSHIHSVVQYSMEGTFGATADHVWVSPLAAMYWFFSLQHVTRTNLILEHIGETKTLWEIAAVIEALRKTFPVKVRCAIPL